MGESVAAFLKVRQRKQILVGKGINNISVKSVAESVDTFNLSPTAYQRMPHSLLTVLFVDDAYRGRKIIGEIGISVSLIAPVTNNRIRAARVFYFTEGGTGFFSPETLRLRSVLSSSQLTPGLRTLSRFTADGGINRRSPGKDLKCLRRRNEITLASD